MYQDQLLNYAAVAAAAASERFQLPVSSYLSSTYTRTTSPLSSSPSLTLQ